MTTLRPITPADHAAVLAWNEADVELLAPLSAARFQELLGWADLAAVIEQDGAAAGFVLTFAAGSDYDSPNFRWFAARHDAFGYLDRIVIDPAFRRIGVASRAYDAIEEHVGAFAPVLCLEVNLDPPNDPSLAFHERRGYREVGQESAYGHRLSMREKSVPRP